jgi:hypothetical protein
MSIRILYWNIQNFTMKTIDNTRCATDKLDHIIQVFNSDVPPDLFVVVEVFARTDEAVAVEGTVLPQYYPSAKACFALLGEIRAQPGMEEFCLVPPLALGSVGYTEGVAVFYNPNSLQFIGPRLYYKWNIDPASQIGQAQPVRQNTYQHIIDYPLNWKNCLPNPGNTIAELRLDRDWPFNIGLHQPVRIKEWNLAGEWQYWRKKRPVPSGDVFLNSARIQFPGSGNRAPFWTQFYDLDAQVTNPRVINLFTVHTSPPTAVKSVERMGEALEMTTVDNNAVNVILGDFNIDSFSPKAEAYDWLLTSHYTMHWDPRVGHTGDAVEARMPYCMTHYLPVTDATPFRAGRNPDAQNNIYPRYGYMGSAWPILNLSGAIDNVFTLYGPNSGGPPAQNNMTILNKVVGNPYNKITAPATVTAELRGGVLAGSTMSNEIPQVDPTGGIKPWRDTIAFSDWRNFGRIRGTSDHLPLLIDV